MIGRQTGHYRPGTVLMVHGNMRSLATMDLHQARCEAKLSPAFEHSSRAELLIRTIA